MTDHLGEDAAVEYARGLLDRDGGLRGDLAVLAQAVVDLDAERNRLTRELGQAQYARGTAERNLRYYRRKVNEARRVLDGETVVFGGSEGVPDA